LNSTAAQPRLGAQLLGLVVQVIVQKVPKQEVEYGLLANLIEAKGGGAVQAEQRGPHLRQLSEHLVREAVVKHEARPQPGRATRLTTCYFAWSKHGSIVDGQYGPCNQSDTWEWRQPYLQHVQSASVKRSDSLQCRRRRPLRRRVLGVHLVVAATIR
jgi:hypothetical protein